MVVSSDWREDRPPLALWSLVMVGAMQMIVHFVTNGNYGIFRDEFYYLECVRHLDWGYVDHPPLSIALLAASVRLFGDGQWPIRILTALTGGALVFMSGALASRLGGGRFAQILAAICALVSPVYLANTSYYSLNAFDILFWTLALYVAIDILDGRRDRWLWFGVVIGLGLQNKISVLFPVAGIGLGIILSGRWRLLLDKMVIWAVLIAALIFLPHVIWQIHHGWPTIEFMRNAEQYKNVSMNLGQFLGGQIFENGPVNAAIWLIGLVALLTAPRFRGYRAIGIAYIVIFLMFVMTNAKVYYLSPIYTILLAAGAVLVEGWVSRVGRRWLRPVAISLVLVAGAIVAPMAIPILPVETFIRYSKALGFEPPTEERLEMGVLPQHFADRFGWEHLADKVATVYFRLSPVERADCMIHARNYGEAGAITYYGRRRGLPPAVSQHNSYYLWGTGNYSGNTILMVRRSLENLGDEFESIEVADTILSRYAMPYESNLMILVCRGIKVPLGKFWVQGRLYN